MAEPLLNPTQQRILIYLLAVMLLIVSLIGLWLCRRLSKARDRHYVKQREAAETIIVLPDRRTKQSEPPKRTSL